MNILKPLRSHATKIILLFVALMIASHISLMVFYTQQNKSRQLKSRRIEVIQQIMNVLHMTQATPTGELKSAIDNLALPDTKVKLDNKAKWPLKVNDLSFWKINRLVPYGAKTIDLSLHLPDGRWLNMEAMIATPPWWPQLFLFFLEMFIFAIVAFYLWSINRFTKPLQAFRSTAERLGVEQKTVLPLEEYKGPVVVRETAQAMNNMQQRIKDLIHDRTLMIAAISHDLRTPITRLKIRANLFEDQELKHNIIRNLDEMEAMISEVLTFTHNDYTSEEKVKLDLNALLQTLCDEFADVAYPVKYTGTEKRAAISGRPLVLKRAFSNLIQNAIKYGRVADVTLRFSQDKYKITIEDDGPGIPERELTKVFSPFYRCDHSRSRQVAGTGLGLAIARDAIRAHRGDISLKNRDTGGLTVEVTL